MLTPVCQRWRDRRGTYRPAGEPIQTRRYEVALIEKDNGARPFVMQHHYSGSYVAARLRAGLYCGGELVGVAVLSVPASQAALAVALPFDAKRAELGRFVLLDSVPANGESWFLTRVFELARQEGFEAVYADSDPAPRVDALGERVFAGHIGTIYQACNATYIGKSRPSSRRLFPDGKVLNNRAIGKLRLGHRGKAYVTEELVRYGAPPPEGDLRAWAKRAVEQTTRTQRHQGNYRYTWALDKRLRRHLREALPYPKFEGLTPR